MKTHHIPSRRRAVARKLGLTRGIALCFREQSLDHPADEVTCKACLRELARRPRANADQAARPVLAEPTRNRDDYDAPRAEMWGGFDAVGGR